MLFRLSGGRLLEFAAYGTPLATHTSAIIGAGASNRDCINILYHHGWPSCRHEAAFLQPLAQELGLRVLAVNRPGVGRTTLNQASFNFRTIVDDVRQLLDGLGLDKVVFMGTSGGGPYACACACLLPERTAAVCLVAGMTQTRDAPGLLQGMALSNRLGFLAINHTPRLVGAALGAGTAVMRLAGSVLGVGPMAAAAARRNKHGGGNDNDGTLTVNDLYGSEGAAVHDERVERSAGKVTAPPAGSAAAAVAGGAAVVKPSAAASGGAAAGGGGGSGGAGGGGASLRRVALGVGLSAAATSLMLAAAGFSAADRAAVARQLRQRPELGSLMARSGSEALAQGLSGLWADMRLTSEPWGLPLERITAPTFVWQGDQDLNVTVAMARHLAHVIPGAAGRLRLVPGAGHISLGLDHGGEVLRELVELLRTAEEEKKAREKADAGEEEGSTGGSVAAARGPEIPGS